MLFSTCVHRSLSGSLAVSLPAGDTSVLCSRSDGGLPSRGLLGSSWLSHAHKTSSSRSPRWLTLPPCVPICLLSPCPEGRKAPDAMFLLAAADSFPCLQNVCGSLPSTLCLRAVSWGLWAHPQHSPPTADVLSPLHPPGLLFFNSLLFLLNPFPQWEIWPTSSCGTF